MKYLTLTLTEFRKLRHSRILLLLLLPLVILWLPNVVNAEMSLTPVMEGITPEHNFLIQSFMGFAWFIFPASIRTVDVSAIRETFKDREATVAQIK